jgi:hypothetical protein
MSRTANPYDNAQVESFIKTLKHEEVYLHDYATVQDAIDRLPHFLEDIYNRKRLRSSLGYRSPEEGEGRASRARHHPEDGLQTTHVSDPTERDTLACTRASVHGIVRSEVPLRVSAVGGRARFSLRQTLRQSAFQSQTEVAASAAQRMTNPLRRRRPVLDGNSDYGQRAAPRGKTGTWQ